jgi:hypothetical protein
MKGDFQPGAGLCRAAGSSSPAPPSTSLPAWPLTAASPFASRHEVVAVAAEHDVVILPTEHVVLPGWSDPPRPEQEVVAVASVQLVVAGALESL